ncbi:hypothetical protein BO99DRAFT_449195 [Aspergillus violaceofuscus CBS 115571]|uniref:Apple domain-containing protein n=1 Tax=Aspergillus violaceofuscus (strain CBS 115571) TaxID=1450538 RepID=A0A2V5H221_ASPV1|nr:hypothetical protein BO99DRAFT_449195 [Aspergillus violaceofuscus CBS 115571]
MTVKLAIFLLGLCVFAPLSLAQQSTTTCLTPAGGSSVSNKAACCPSGNEHGEEQVDGVIYEYACGKYASRIYGNGYYAANAYECAKHCAAQASASPPCHAASWTASSDRADTGTCYLSQEGFVSKTDNSGEYLLLIRTDRTGPKCEDELLAKDKECLDAVNAKEQERVDAVHAKDQERVDAVKTNEDSCQTRLKNKDQQKATELATQQRNSVARLVNCDSEKAQYLTGKNVRFQVFCLRCSQACLNACAAQGNCQAGWYDFLRGICYRLDRKRTPAQFTSRNDWSLGFTRV